MNLSLTILQILSESGGYLVPVGTLKASVRLRRNPAPTDDEILMALSDLESRGQALRVRNEDTGDKWQTTDDGAARLVKAGI